MGEVLLFIKLNIVGIGILVLSLVVLAVLIFRLKYEVNHRLLYYINIAEIALGSGQGKDKKNYVLSIVYNNYPWLKDILSKKVIDMYIDNLVKMANKVYGLSTRDNKSDRQILTQEEIAAVKELAYSVILNEDKEN